jgi:hypothetical protein
MAGERRSLQDLIRSRQQSGFLGRRAEVTQYKENLGLAPDDERRQFLFNIHGNAGVGKTYLTKQLRQAADDSGALTAYTDEAVDDLTSAMSAIAEEFGRGGVRFREFEKRVAAYRQRRHELESDPDAPDGVAAFLTKTALTIGLHAARDVPIAGSILAPVDDAKVIDSADRAREYVARKFSDHADMRLLLSPADELTPVFLAGLNRAAASRPIALFFDTYERTSPMLDRWLRDLYAGRYGDLPGTLITTIAGQHALNANLWADYLPVISDVLLEPFSEAEARQFLASKNITDGPAVEVILTLSGRLPMWLTTLAEAHPDDAALIGDPAGDAVDRFLKWEQDPARRNVAVTAALPRRLNQDVLSILVPPEDAPGLFGWLCGLPFIAQQAGGWRYHDVARAAMLRLQRAQSPARWRAHHARLAEAHAQWAAEAAAGTSQPWPNQDWADYTREKIYHLLCADPAASMPGALASAVEAAREGTARARQWAAIFTDAGQDTGHRACMTWGQRLTDGISDADLTGYLNCIIDDGHLDAAALALAVKERGNNHALAGRYDAALADFARAIELNPTGTFSILPHPGADAGNSGLTALGPYRYKTLSLRDHVYVGQDRRIATVRTSRVIEAIADNVDRIPVLYDTSIFTLEVGQGCKEISSSLHEIGDGIYALDIILAHALRRGETAALECQMIYHTSGDIHDLYEREYRRAIGRHLLNLEIRVEFHSAALPAAVWWSSWDGPHGSIVQEELVLPDHEHSVHKVLPVLANGVVGFYWAWT